MIDHFRWIDPWEELHRFNETLRVAHGHLAVFFETWDGEPVGPLAKIRHTIDEAEGWLHGC